MSLYPDTDEERLDEMILEEFGTIKPAVLADMLEAVARRLRVEPECNHPQLYAYATIDVILPIEHNSAAEMTRVLDRISSVLLKTDLTNYRVRSGIEVNDVGKFL